MEIAADLIRVLAEKDRIAFKKHSILRMNQRGILADEVKEVLLSGEIIESKEKKAMKCVLCSGGMERSAISVPYEMDQEYILVVRGVPAWVCRQCGDSFLDISVVRALEKIVATARQNGVTMGFIEYRNAA